MHKMEGGTRIDLFDVIPQNDFAVNVFFWVALLAAVFLTVGFLTRISSLVVWLALTSMDERALYAMHSGDTFLRIAAFFLMFTPAGAAISVDRLIRIWKGKDQPEIQPRSVWAQRMIQYLAALVYFMTAWWKATGTTWVDGTAIYYVRHLEQFHRFPMPSFMDNPAMVKLQTWLGLAIEFALGTLIWIREVRYWVLLAGVGLHLTLEYTMNVPLFQFIMMSTFILFIDPADLDRVWAAVRARVAVRLGPAVKLVYDSSCVEGLRRVNVVRALDVLRMVEVIDDGAAVSKFRTTVGAKSYMVADSARGPRAGFDVLLELARVIPLLWPLRVTALFRRERVGADDLATAYGPPQS
jgi:hypothetical protein